jgi:FkbM family methyltransferase
MPQNLPFSFLDLFDVPPVSIVDVGAAPTKKGPIYQPLIDRGLARVTGFEPDPRAFAKLQASANDHLHYISAVVGDGNPGVFHKTTFRYTSSLYEPDLEFCARFSGLSSLLQPMTQNPTTTQKLDDLISAPDLDFLKIDVQGGELGVLKGASRLLSKLLLVETEVEFVPLYKEQPLFADIDAHMRGAGFYLHRFSTIETIYFHPVLPESVPTGSGSQIAFANAIYIRDLSAVDLLPLPRLLKLVAMLHDFYSSWDLCLHLLDRLAQRGTPEPYARYAGAVKSASKGAQ